jgi:hypothetical protein
MPRGLIQSSTLLDLGTFQARDAVHSAFIPCLDQDDYPASHYEPIVRASRSIEVQIWRVGTISIVQEQC